MSDDDDHQLRAGLLAHHEERPSVERLRRASLREKDDDATPSNRRLSISRLEAEGERLATADVCDDKEAGVNPWSVLIPGLGVVVIKKVLALVVAVVVFVTFWVVDVTGSCPKASRTFGTVIVTALLWTAEVTSLHVIALLPVILLSMTGVDSFNNLAHQFWSGSTYLIFGGFLLSAAIERTGLHFRIALNVLAFSARWGLLGVLMGFFLISWFLSMWMSNTATTLCLLPIVAVSLEVLEKRGYKKAADQLAVPLYLGIAYSASLGGVCTLVGTPPNPLFIQTMLNVFPNAPPTSFASWMGATLPCSLVVLVIMYLYFYFLIVRPAMKGVSVSWDFLKTMRDEQDKITPNEIFITMLLIFTILLWMLRAEIPGTEVPGWSHIFPQPEYITDGWVVLLVTVPLFFIPSFNKGDRHREVAGYPHNVVMRYQLEWAEIKGFPWELFVLFGGGLTLASAFRTSGLANWFAIKLTFVKDIPFFFAILILVTFVLFLTEINSNTATASVMFPVMGALGVSIGQDPRALMIPIAIACSFAFMLPIATAPNMVVFGTGKVPLKTMIKYGFVLNLVGIVVITLFAVTLIPPIIGYRLGNVPSWAPVGNTTSFACPPDAGGGSH